MMNMKRLSLILSLVVILSATPAWAASSKNDHAMKRMLKIHGRGLVNVATFWIELPETTVAEFRAHPKAWPFTFIPKSFTHMTYRLFSGIYDVSLFTLLAPFTDDTRPLTEHMGIPAYAWQKDVETFA